LQKLREEIKALKARFPGKLDPDIDTDSIIEALHAHAQRLKNPNGGLKEKCATGVLGRELEEAVNSLTGSVKKIKKRVEGETPAYTAKDSVIGVLGKAKSPASAAGRSISIVVKTICFLLILSLGPFTYLLVSMDRKGALLKEIKKSEAEILTKKELISSKERERASLSQKIQSMQSDNVPREIKIEIMDMNVKIHSLDQVIHRAEAEISDHEDNIRDAKSRIKDIRERSFLERLLRR
jgi:hypothetical protein